MPSPIYDITVTDIDGTSATLGRHRGRVLLIVNVASKCGYTPQYQGLEAVFRRRKDEGLVVLGFPCDQFGHQEPGSEADIREFCANSYDVTFPLFSKINVNGADAHPLYRFLRSERKGLLGTEAIKWNFTKFLVDRAGQVVTRYGPGDTPEAIEPDIVNALSAPA